MWRWPTKARWCRWLTRATGRLNCPLGESSTVSYDRREGASYGSGHSTFGAAVATVLAAFFGTDTYALTVASDSTSEMRTYASFSATSEENGLSRIYDGVHFAFDNASSQAMVVAGNGGAGRADRVR